MLKDMKVGTKLLLGFGNVLGLLSLIVIAALLSMSRIDSSMGKILNQSNVSMKYANSISKEISGIFRSVQAILLHSSIQEKNSEKERLVAARTRYGDALKNLEAMAQDETDKRLIDNLKKAIANAKDANNRALELSMDGRNAEAVSLYNEEIATKLIPPIFNAVDEILTHEDAKSTAMEKAAEKTYQTGRRVIVVASLVAIGLGIFIAVLLTGNIRKPLAQAVEVMRRMAEGDLTVSIETDRKDEIGNMLKALKEMDSKFINLIGDIKRAVESLSSASTQLSASSEEISRSMGTQSGRATQIATAAEEMSQTVVDVAKNSSSIAESAHAASEKAKEGEAAVKRSIEESNVISATVNTSAQVMKSLGLKSKQIGEIVSVINDIADQTNLLALNAAIEAARAGEQGRGFAVVADEVRKLAERTAKATAEITTMIRSVQDEVNEAIVSMDTSTKRVDAGVSMSLEAGRTLREIVDSVDKLQSMVQQIASATEEMSSVAETISGDVQSIAQGSKEIAGGSEQIAETSSDIARQGTSLHDAVSRFRL